MKKALITGASRGIGAAIERKFAENGYKLLLFYNENEEVISFARVPIKVQNKALGFATVIVENDDNGNGILEAGETADFGIVINNTGNEIYNSSKCSLNC